MFPLTKCFILLVSFYGISAILKSFDTIALSDAFMSLYRLIRIPVIPSYYVCDCIVLCWLFLPTVFIRVAEFS